MSTFGDRLKNLRIEKNLTQQDIADILGVGRATIAGYETKGKQPDFDKLKSISDYFDVSIDYLLGRTDERKLIPCPDVSNFPDEDAKQFMKYLNMDITLKSVKSGDKHSELSKKDKQEIDEYIKDLESNVAGLMFDGQPISDEDKQLLLEQIERTAELIKLRNKEKYTPKKYRKK